jgi:hypothetical protein
MSPSWTFLYAGFSCRIMATDTTTRKVYIETFGCQMNKLDSELLSGQLRTEG